MDKTNKITITCNNWDERVDISQAVADMLKINMLGIDDYIIRGSVMNGDLDEFPKEAFVSQYGENLFSVLENLSYMAYVKTVDEPFVISIDDIKNESNAPILRETISIDVNDNTKTLSSAISDYTIKKEKSASATAKKIANIVLSDERWG